MLPAFRVSRVCRLWRRVASDPTLWHNIDLSSKWVSKNPIVNELNFRWLCENRLANVQELNLGKSWLTSQCNFRILFFLALLNASLLDCNFFEKTIHLNGWTLFFPSYSFCDADTTSHFCAWDFGVICEAEFLFNQSECKVKIPLWNG